MGDMTKSRQRLLALFGGRGRMKIDRRAVWTTWRATGPAVRTLVEPAVTPASRAHRPVVVRSMARRTTDSRPPERTVALGKSGAAVAHRRYSPQRVPQLVRRRCRGTTEG